MNPRSWPLALAAAAIAALIGLPLAIAFLRPPPVPAPPPAPPAAPIPRGPPRALQTELDAMARAFGDPVGIAVTDLAGGWTAKVAGDEDFPQQSVSKLWVAVALLDRVDGGEWRLDDPVALDDDDRSVFFQPVTEAYGPHGYATTRGELLSRAIIESDNAAADRLVRDLGGAGAVQAVLDRKGLGDIRAGGEERHL